MSVTYLFDYTDGYCILLGFLLGMAVCHLIYRTIEKKFGGSRGE